MSPTTHRLLLAATAAAALALPASAAAHPGIFTVDAKVVPPGSPTPPTLADTVTQAQFAIINDGRVIVLRESNGVSGNGMLNYKKLPGTVRANPAEFPSKADWLAYAPAQTDLQLHATCLGGSALNSTANVLAWQEDPFFDYVPWQRASAGLGDDPAEWIPVAKAATGVDLSTLSSVEDFTTACTNLGGVYHPADTVVTTPANASAASISDAVAPVQAELVDVKAQLTALTSAKGAVDSQVTTTAAALAAAQNEAAAAKAEVARLRLELTPLALTVGEKRTPKAFGATGQPLTVTAAPGASVTVTAKITTGKAKALGLRSTTLGKATATASSTGSASLTVEPSAKAAKALTKARGSLKVSFTATSGQRSTTTAATLAR